MPITPAVTGENQTIDNTSYQRIYPPLTTPVDPRGAKLASMLVRCRADSPVSIRVRVPALHGPNGSALLSPGTEQIFRVSNYGLDEVFVETNTGKVDWFGVAIV